ncbi:NHL repeat-containing protein [Candidatus Latescibacterota bacterium]
MRGLLYTFLLYSMLSCSGAVEKAKPPRDSVSPPDVTGSVRLDFLQTFGQNIGISSPGGISFGIDGTLYVCDRDRSSIVRLDNDGTVISRFEGFASCGERMFVPVDVCTSSGLAVYTVDAVNSRVIRFDRFLKNAGVIYRKDADSTRRFGTFNGLAFDTATGDLFITDSDTGAVIRIDMLGGTIQTMGEFGTVKNSMKSPAGLDVTDDGTLYIADEGYGALAVVKHFGGEIRYIGEKVLEAPVDAVALPGGKVAVADRRGILIMSETGTPDGRAGYGVERNISPRSVEYRDGKLYVSDGISGLILVYIIDMDIK